MVCELAQTQNALGYFTNTPTRREIRLAKCDWKNSELSVSRDRYSRLAVLPVMELATESFTLTKLSTNIVIDTRARSVTSGERWLKIVRENTELQKLA